MSNLGLFGYFFSGDSSTLFSLGRGPITPPGPAMVRTDLKDLNLNKKEMSAVRKFKYVNSVVNALLNIQNCKTQDNDVFSISP